MKRAVAALILMLGLTGCGNERRLPEQLPPADDPVAWAGRVCSSLGPLSGLRNLRPSFDPNDPATSKDSLSRFFDDTRARIAESLRGLDQVGPSPIAGGDDVTVKLRGGLERMRGGFADARAKVDAVDSSDPVELGAKLPEILNGLATVSNDRDLLSVGENQAFNDAVRDSPSCALIKPAG